MFFQIQEHFGVEVGQWLRSQFGGKTIRIPQSIKSGHVLELIGKKQSEDLAYFYGGLSVWIPKTQADQIELRDLKIKADFDIGVSISTLALNYSMSRRNVFKCLRRARIKERNAA